VRVNIRKHQIAEDRTGEYQETAYSRQLFTKNTANSSYNDRNTQDGVKNTQKQQKSACIIIRIIYNKEE